MRKTLLLVIMSVFGIFFPKDIFATQRESHVAKTTSTTPSFYAVTATPTVGISKFVASGDPLTLSEVFSDNDYGYITERIYGVYGDGKLFFYQPRINNNSELWKLRFVTYKLDGDKWSYEKNVELTPSYNNYPHFMSYDPQTKTLYGFRNGLSGCEEYVIDQTTGGMSLVKTLGTYFNMIVTDTYGQSYATDWDGNFYTIDLSTGEYKLVGSTGISSDDALVGIVDPTTNRIYQNLSKYGSYTLYEIDKATGAATKVGAYPSGTNVRGLVPIVSSQQGGGTEPASFKLYGMQYEPIQGIVSFDPKAPASAQIEFEDGQTGVQYFRSGSVSAFDGNSVYVYTPKTNSNGELTSLKFSVYKQDGSTWKMDKEISLEPQYTNYPNRMAYDPVTGNIYGFRNGMPTNFYTIDKETGAMSCVGSINNGFFASLAIDRNGDFFAFDYDCRLNKLDLSSGTFSPVGSLGQSFGDMQPTYIDASTNTMYWVSTTTKQSQLYTVDLSTGSATEVGEMPENAKYFGLFGVGSAGSSDKQVPDVCQELTATYAVPGSLKVTLTATAPVLAFDKQTELKGKVALKFYADDQSEPFKTVENITAGDKASVEYTFAEAGKHKVKVVASNENGDGPSKTISTFAGFDQPKAPTNIVLAIDSNGIYSLSWDAPTVGVNGGAIDVSNIKYIITQYPVSKLVGESATTSFSGTINTTSFADYYFGVKAISNEQVGEEGLSNHVTFGDYAEVPYYDDFSDVSTHGTYTVLNVNNDATWQIIKATTGSYAAIYDGSQCADVADDYLVLPPMDIRKGVTYTVSFSVASAFNQDYGNNIDLVLLKSTSKVDDGKVKIGSFENIPDYTKAVSQKAFDYTATEDGKAYFAFYCRSAANRKVTLYDIQIIGSGFANAPQEVTGLKAVPAERGEHKVTVSFDAPTADIQGNSFTKVNHIKVYRDSEKAAIKTFSNVASGEHCTFIDTTVTAGNHTYSVIAVTKDGSSTTAMTKVFVGQGIPAAPTDFRVAEDDTDFILSWAAPTTSTDGNYIDFDKLTYAVYYQYGLMETPSLLNGEVSGTELRVPKDMFDDYASAHQILISFMIMAQTENGFSDVQATDIIYGPDYQLPFQESFADGYAVTEPWGILNVSPEYVNCWFMIADNNSSKPMAVNSVDKDNGMAMFYQQSVDGYEARLLTPRISTGESKNPVLSFYVYHYGTSDAANTLQIELQYGSDEFEAIGEPISIYGEDGWKEHRVSLSAAQSDQFRVVIRGKANKSQPIFIDNIEVLDDESTSIQNILANPLCMTSTNGGLTFVQGTVYEIYTLAGAKVSSGIADGKKIRLTSGMYIVKAEGKTYKIVIN